jgi:hypothetical protein
MGEWKKRGSPRAESSAIRTEPRGGAMGRSSISASVVDPDTRGQRRLVRIDPQKR